MAHVGRDERRVGTGDHPSVLFTRVTVALLLKMDMLYRMLIANILLKWRGTAGMPYDLENEKLAPDVRRICAEHLI